MPHIFFENAQEIMKQDFAVSADMCRLYQTGYLTEFVATRNMEGRPFRIVQVHDFTKLRKYKYYFSDSEWVFCCIPLSDLGELVKLGEYIQDVSQFFYLYLYFTKVDIFEQDIKSGKQCLADFFPEYKGGNDIDLAKSFITEWSSKLFIIQTVQIMFINNLAPDRCRAPTLRREGCII